MHSGPETKQDGLFDEIGASLRNALKYVAVGASAVALSTGLPGCSPQQNSYWTGTYTTLPAPPDNARTQVGVSTEDDGTVFINYIIWDSATNDFKRQDVHYTTTFWGPGTFSEAGGYVQEIKDGEVLSGGIIVDQKAGVLLLPNGYRVDGKTGDVRDASGYVVKSLER